MGPLDWGDVPTWIGGAGALAAGWFAYQTIKSQRQQLDEQRQFIGEQSRFMAEQQQNLQLERAELRAAAEDRKHAQARQVHMRHHTSGGADDGAGGRVGYDHWVVVATNRSDAPLHNVEVRFGTAYIAIEVYEWPADRQPRDRAASRGERWTPPVHLLGPGRAALFTSQRWPEATVDNNRPTLFFTDDGGVRWSLDSYGKLEEAPDNAS
ncbi:hypothetical protein QBB34_21355 [Streptomyces stelliscabiei]|uniref:hypothetical protein n=1 Tax=Streptomyces stelliscabiei TaxID=146820 RepID=UPI002FF0A9A3